MKFYLGTAIPAWLRRDQLAGIPLFLSLPRLAVKRTIPPARWPLALDSGGFSELKMHGRWRAGPVEYVESVRRCVAGLGSQWVDFVAIQDWMTEPVVINGGHTKDGTFVGTGLSVAEHQRRTVDSYLALTALAPEIPWLATVQGFTIAEYLDCVRMYREAGVELSELPVVGVGSVCRRQDSQEIHDIMAELSRLGVKLHGFGVKATGLERYADLLVSADSQSWSYAARRRVGRCPHGIVAWEANCPDYAAAWWGKVNDRIL